MQIIYLRTYFTLKLLVVSFQYFGILHAVSNLSSAEVLVTKSILLIVAYHGILYWHCLRKLPKSLPRGFNAYHTCNHLSSAVTQDAVRELKLIP